MSVNVLYVEGKLDAELLTRICGGRPAVFPIKASKYALKPRTRDDRSKKLGPPISEIAILISFRQTTALAQLSMRTTTIIPC